MARDSAGVIIMVLVLFLFVNTLNNSQAPTHTQQEIIRGIETEMFNTTFDPWPAEGVLRDNARLEVIGGDEETLVTFPVGNEGTTSIDLRGFNPRLRPAHTKAKGCGLQVDAYTPLSLRYSWAEFRMADKRGDRKGVVFGKSDATSVLKRASMTFAVLVASSAGSVEGSYICGDNNFPAELSLRKGVNYIHLEGFNSPFTADRSVVASQKIAYDDPSVVELQNN